MPHTSGTHRSSWSDNCGWRYAMLAKCHHCQHLIEAAGQHSMSPALECMLFDKKKCCRAAAMSLCETSQQRFTGDGFGALRRSDTFWKMSGDDSWSIPLYFLFLTSWQARALAETGQWRGQCRDLYVRLLTILHAFLLECKKSMFWTASAFLSSLDSRAVTRCLTDVN